ncbi:MAG: PIN domain-containing protein [Bacteroidales bacterium]|nr:PIN domain-containing protein [Bacteroidales bacterium]
MKHVFLDTNILVDLILVNRPDHKYAEMILKCVQTGKLLCYTSTQSLLDLAYIITKGNRTRIPDIGNIIQKISNDFIVCDTLKHHVSLAAAHYSSDFEDAVIAATAIDVYCDLIVTNDSTFDDPFGLPIVSPDEFCREFIEE